MKVCKLVPCNVFGGKLNNNTQITATDKKISINMIEIHLMPAIFLKKKSKKLNSQAYSISI